MEYCSAKVWDNSGAKASQTLVPSGIALVLLVAELTTMVGFTNQNIYSKVRSQRTIYAKR